MNEPQISLKQSAKVALAALAMLLAGAIVFYKERVFFGDASFIAFNIINYKGFYLQEHRFGSFITQMTVFFGQKLHLPLKAILIGYSVSFNLFYLAVASILVFRFRQYALAILMSFYYFLFVTDSYFWTNNEIHQAVAWMCLWFGCFLYMGQRATGKIILIPVFVLLSFLTIFTHFVIIIPTVFLWIYYLLDRNNWPFTKATTIQLSIVVAAVIAAKFIFSYNQPYDGAALHGVTHFSVKDVLRTVKTPVVKMFAIRNFTLYMPALLIAAAGLKALYTRDMKKPLIWVLFSAVGYVIIVGLTYGGYDSNFELFHIESEWAPLTFIIAAPFVFTWLPAQKSGIALLVLVLIFAIRIGYISNSAQKFSWRTDFKERVFARMKQKGVTKLAIYNERALQSKLLLDWSVPDECILLSAMNGDRPQLIFSFVSPNDSDELQALSKPGSISISFDMLVPANLNREYYNIDTTTPYTIMTYEELFK